MTFELQEFEKDKALDWKQWRSKSYATAVFPTLALLNHACDHNVAKVFYGKTVLVFAGRNISKGKRNIT